MVPLGGLDVPADAAVVHAPGHVLALLQVRKVLGFPNPKLLKGLAGVVDGLLHVFVAEHRGLFQKALLDVLRRLLGEGRLNGIDRLRRRRGGRRSLNGRGCRGRLGCGDRLDRLAGVLRSLRLGGRRGGFRLLCRQGLKGVHITGGVSATEDGGIVQSFLLAKGRKRETAVLIAHRCFSFRLLDKKRPQPPVQAITVSCPSLISSRPQRCGKKGALRPFFRRSSLT